MINFTISVRVSLISSLSHKPQVIQAIIVSVSDCVNFTNRPWNYFSLLNHMVGLGQACPNYVMGKKYTYIVRTCLMYYNPLIYSLCNVPVGSDC